MTANASPTSGRNPSRSLTYWAFALVVVLYLVIIQVGGRVIGGLADEDNTSTTRGVVATMAVPLGLALIFTYAASRAFQRNTPRQ